MKSTHSLLQRPLRLALLVGWLGAASCTEAPRPCSLVVMDAHSQPPDSGYVVLAKPNNLSNSSSVLGWTVVSDTLHWNEDTGLVLPHAAPPPGSHWRIHSPNPLPATGWRLLSVPFTGADSCVLPIDLPWEVHVRAHRSIGHDIAGYDVHFSSDLDEVAPLAETHVGLGTFHFKGILRTHSFPVRMTLLRRFSQGNQRHLVAQAEFEYLPASPTLSCHWEDGNVDAP